ncbi:mycothiol-dependent nitroreductase Rv2466c family protein [Streptomyces sp. WMMC940]|uniref:mycothiol-dependent nitroreductase Rv2466c family protein n=1 Tax=Streptomyces sp. WMMC940 TaxID=3015153 RepID=UPI0022B6E412|nr:hypothetical protein [Streptomyces sp. WMMC940]MCZ7457684.1 hypothetical protein [Streptomyces sp. WMMC940]
MSTAPPRPETTVTDIRGPEVGTPVIHVPCPDGKARRRSSARCSPPPTLGEAAGTRWDGVRAVASVDGFFEPKRDRGRDPILDRGRRPRPHPKSEETPSAPPRTTDARLPGHPDPEQEHSGQRQAHPMP